MSLTNDDGEGERERPKRNWFRLEKTTTLHVHHAFLYISLPSLHNSDVKLPNFTFFRGRGHRTTTFFSFPEPRCVFYNSNPGKLRKMCQHLTYERDQISTTKFETT